jgi:hypothetical protein
LAADGFRPVWLLLQVPGRGEFQRRLSAVTHGRTADATPTRLPLALARPTSALRLRIGALRDPSCAGHRTAHRCVLRGAVRRASPVARCEHLGHYRSLYLLCACCAGLCVRLPQHDHAVADRVGPGRFAHSAHIRAGKSWARPVPHLHRDWAHPATSAHGLGSPSHVRARAGLTPCHICTGTCLRVQAFADLPFAFVQMSSWCATRTSRTIHSMHRAMCTADPTWRRSAHNMQRRVRHRNQPGNGERPLRACAHTGTATGASTTCRAPSSGALCKPSPVSGRRMAIATLVSTPLPKGPLHK